MAEALSMNQQNVHWFPGHMKKAWRQIEEKLPLIDVLIEVRDARAPQATELPPFVLKPRQSHYIVYNKDDLADTAIIAERIHEEKKRTPFVVSVSLTTKKGWTTFLKTLQTIATVYHRRDEEKGRKPQAVKLMIVGVPNAGKSTLINALVGHRRVATENRAGSTRGQQWVHTEKGFSLLDTPGVLTPRYETQTIAMHLACIGSMKFSILPQEELGRFMFSYLLSHYPHLLKAITDDMRDYPTFLNGVATRRHMLRQGSLNVSLAEETFLHDIAHGHIGRFTLVHETH
jgi:ribosome biogenesis GTPase A